MLVISQRLQIPLSELNFTFVRSGGPGGQRVNKVSTKAVLQWNVAQSPSIPNTVRKRVMEANRRRVNRDGVLVLSSQRFRDQGRNVADCLEKLRQIVFQATQVPKTRKATRPTAAAKRRRLENKRQQAAKKRWRRRPSGDD
jgi:ribosome-associated protein